MSGKGKPTGGASSSSSSSNPKKAANKDLGDDDEDDVKSPATSSSSSSGGATNNPKTDPKADELVKNAEKKMKEFSLFDKTSKYEEAVDMLVKAAAMYKINKNWRQAGDTYVKVAEIQMTKLNDQTDACNKYLEAAKAFKNCSLKDAQIYFQKGVDMHMENNRMSTAAKIFKELAELSEKEGDRNGAMNAYQKAADCYLAEDSAVNAGSMRIKVAQLAAESKDYARAIEIFEDVSRGILDSNKNIWSVKDYLFKAMLCHLALSAKAHDMLTTEDALERYREMYPQIDGTREHKLIDESINAFKDDDGDAFQAAVRRFDEVVRLDDFTAEILMDVKKVMEDGPGDAPPLV